MELRKQESSFAESFETLKQQGGFEPLTQLDSLTVALSPFDESGSGFVAIGGGKFEPERLLSWIHAKARELESFVPPLIPVSHRDRRLFTDAFRGKLLEAAFFGQTAVALGSPGWGRKLVDVALGVEPPAIANPTIANLLRGPAEPAVVWAIAWFDQQQREGIARAIGGRLVNATLGLDVHDGLRASLHIVTEAEADVAPIEAKLRVLLDHVRRDPSIAALDAVTLLDQAVFSRNDTSLHISLHINSTQLSKLIEKLERATKRRGVVRPGDPI